MASPQPNPGYKDAHWIRSPLTTRHSQMTLLLISLFWGLSYCMPEKLRIPFSEVFPPSLERWSSIPMAGWGAMLLLGAVTALIGERLIMRELEDPRLIGGRFGWRMSIFSHMLLVGLYVTLSIAALVTGVRETAMIYHWQVPSLISSISRPVLWGYLAWLHLSYSKLPTPFPFQGPGKQRQRKRKLKIRLFVRVPIDGEDDE